MKPCHPEEINEDYDAKKKIIKRNNAELLRI